LFANANPSKNMDFQRAFGWRDGSAYSRVALPPDSSGEMSAAGGEMFSGVLSERFDH
jgi:hypothetical protein